MLLGLIGFVYSCSDKKESMELLNSAPEIFLVKKGTKLITLTDSIRLYDGYINYYNLKLAMADSNLNQWKATYQVDTGEAKVYYQGSELLLPSIRVDASEVALSASATKLGLNVISFTAEDRFGKTAKANLRLFVFDNLPPVADLQYTLTGTRLYEFDGSASRDPDANYDGRVVTYVFEIEGKEFQSSSPIVRHIFSIAGIYTVKLRVIDNSGATSPSVNLRLTVS